MLNNRNLKIYLFICVFGISLFPLAVSIFVVDEVLDHVMGLVANQKIRDILVESQNDLKRLRDLDPDREEDYHQRFERIQDELVVYYGYPQLRKALRNTYLTYYLVIVAAVLVFALVSAALLSRKITRSYAALLVRDVEKERRLQQLQFIQEWKQIADDIAHEIKNALTPIEIKINALTSDVRLGDDATPNTKVADAQEIIHLELSKLKKLVFHFSMFAKLPAPTLTSVSLTEHLEKFVRQYGDTWPEARLKLSISTKLVAPLVALDSILFNQVLINIINNAVQANAHCLPVDITFTIEKSHQRDIALTIENSGLLISPDVAEKLFELRFSTANNEHNMGLGLSIAKKIMLEHGGDIVNLPRIAGAAFSLTLPADNG